MTTVKAEPQDRPQLDVPSKPLFVWYKGKKSKPELIARALRSLAMVLRVGRSEATALEVVGEQFKRYEVGRALLDAADVMRNHGGNLQAALLAQDVLPRTAKELIDAAGTSSALHRNLVKAAELVGDAVNVRKRLMNQLIQPAFMVGLCVVFLFIATAFIIPGFITVFGQIGADTPTMTVVLMQVAEVIKWVVGSFIVVAVLLGLYWLLLGRKSPKVRAFVDRQMLKIPGVGPVLQLAATARMFQLLSSSLESGQPEPESLKSAVRGCGNDAIREHGEDHAQRMVNEGIPLREVMDSKMFPVAAQKMILSAPSIIQQVEVMKEMAREYEVEAKLELDKVAKTLEPTVNYLVYGMSGLLIIMVMLPMYSMYPAIMDLGETSSTTPMPLP